MNLQKSHDFSIDKIRAIAIILVVFAHSVIIYDPGWPHFTSVNESPILKDIKIVFALIHMPVFTFLSGILFCKKPRSITFQKLIIDKSKRVLIPYLFFAVCWMIPVKLLIGFQPYVNTNTA